MNRIFNLQEQGERKIADVRQGSWLAVEIAKAVEAGYLTLDQQGNAFPNDKLTRADAAVALNELFQFTKPEGTELVFKDLDSDESVQEAVAALAARGYIKGYSDGSFRPNKTITRAEIAVLLDRLIGLFVNEQGTVSAGETGNAVVNSANSVIEDTHMTGNLYLAPGIGDGDVDLKSVTVEGTSFVQGGGENTVTFTDSTLNEIKINKKDDKVRVLTEGSTEVGKVLVNSGAILEGNFGSIIVSPTDEAGQTPRVEVRGSIEQLTIDSPINLILAENTVIKVLVATEKAKDSSIEGTGKLDRLENAAEIMLNGKNVQAGDGNQNLPEQQDEPMEEPPVEENANQEGTESNTPPVSQNPGGNNGGSNPGNSTPDYITNPPQAVGPWSFVWGDEFNDSDNNGTLDSSKWTYDTTNGLSVGNPGWGNNELQYYTDRPQNVKEQNGKLLITALQESYEGFNYTSARVKTKGKYSKKYGRIEVRAKAPTGKGLWPAIWMLPENNVYGTWAASGEIDIMEGWGSRPHDIVGTIHYGSQFPGNTYSGEEYTFTNSTIEDFHTYAIEWEPGEIRWYVDGHLYSTKNDWYSKSADQPASNAYPAPFDQDFHLLLNLAVGGNFDGNPTPETIFPRTMEIDYVRVYELTGREYREPVAPTLTKEEYPAGSKLPLEDGNLVYNSDFTQTVEGDAGLGIPGTAHWAFYKDPGAAGTAELDSINGRNFVKINITSAGGNSYSIQPQAIVSLAKGRYYKLTFDAKTDTQRNMMVKATGGQSRGYEGYSPSLDVALTSELQSFETVFQMKKESDIAARMEFNMGTNAHPVWIGNVKLVEVEGMTMNYDAPKTPYGANGNHIYNSSFDQGDTTRMNYWHLAVEEGAEAAASVDWEERKLRVNVTNGGSAPSDVRVLQRGIQLIQGQKYQFTFTGSASEQKEVVIELRSKDGSIVYHSQPVTLQQTEGLHTVNFTMTGNTTSEAQVILNLGGSPTQLVLDDITLVRTSIYLDPAVVKFPLLNGQFDGGLAAWENIAIDGASAVAAGVNSKAKLSINSVGANPWSVLLFQNNLALSGGVRYVVEFDAYSTVSRKMQVVAENASYQRSFDQTVDLTTVPQRYKFEFVKTNGEAVGLKFLLGNVAGNPALAAHDVFIDNVVMEPKGARELSSKLSNGTFDENVNGWTNFFADWNGVNGSVTAEDGHMKVNLSRSGPDNWSAQLDNKNLLIEQGKSYRLTFDAWSSMTRDIQVTVEHGGEPYTKYLEPKTISLGNSPKTFSYTFTMAAGDDSEAHLNFLLGNIGGAIDSMHDIYFDNISIIEVTMPPMPPAEGHALLNGSFESNTENWQVYKADGSNAEISVENQQLKVNFPNYDGFFQWSTQVFQDHLKLESGKTYVLSFNMSSSVNKSVLVELLKGSSGHHLAAQAIDLTSAPQSFSYEFTVTGDTDQNAKLAFLLGSKNVPAENFTAHHIFIDEITLVEKP